MGSVIRSAGVAKDARRGRRSQAKEKSLPSAEEIFVAWRLWLPDGVDLAAAARQEISRIDRHAPLPPELERLRGLLIAAIAASTAA